MARHLRALGDPTEFHFTAATYVRDGFGPEPAFHGLVAETSGNVVGYLLYHFGYDCDFSVRVMYIIDLFVLESVRCQGTGRALMSEAESVCRCRDVATMIWNVWKPNEAAYRFYRNLGAKDMDELSWMYLEVSGQ